MSSRRIVGGKEKKEQGTCMSARFLAQFNPPKKKKRKLYPFEYRQQHQLLHRNDGKDEKSHEEKTQIEMINIGYMKMLKTHKRRLNEALIVQKCWRQFEPEPRRKRRRKRRKKLIIEPLPELILDGSVDQNELKPPFYVH